MKIKNKYKLVLIEWEDSAMGFTEWRRVNEINATPMMIISMGFLTHDNKRSVTVCPHIENDKGKNKIICGEMTIPKSAIRKMYEISTSEHQRM